MLDRLRRKGVPIAFETEVISIKAADGQVFEVTTRSATGLDNHYPGHLVSSIQIEDVAKLLLDTSRLWAKPARPPADVEQNVVLVYLFLDEPCRFPHAWLEVNDTELRSGGSPTTPPSTATWCPKARPVCAWNSFASATSDHAAVGPAGRALAIRECVDNGLIDLQKLVDTFVTTMRRTNAAASWRDWQKAFKRQLLQEVSDVANLFHVNRPGMDWAAFAGMVAAEPMLEGCRSEFDRRADPTKRYRPDRSTEGAEDAVATPGG
jgi:hypothetical protein